MQTNTPSASSTLLRLDTSPRVTDSHSRTLGDHFELQWRARHPQGQIQHRDLATMPVPHIAQDTITGFYTPPDAMTPALRSATALSDQLIAEVQSVETLLITTPMYNFGIPSALKAWIDHVVRIGHTFSYDGKGFTGLVKARRAVICCVYGAGGYLGEGAPFAGANFVQPYLQFLLGFLGITEVQFFAAEATTADPATVQANLSKAREQINHYLQATA